MSFFDSIIRVKTIDNKLGSFLLSGVIVCMHCWQMGRDISSLDFIVETCHKEPTLCNF